ncbi:hypothetical protein BJY59DRAFT_696449, partial [Rhodotorula toruloides]
MRLGRHRGICSGGSSWTNKRGHTARVERENSTRSPWLAAKVGSQPGRRSQIGRAPRRSLVSLLRSTPLGLSDCCPPPSDRLHRPRHPLARRRLLSSSALATSPRTRLPLVPQLLATQLSSRVQEKEAGDSRASCSYPAGVLRQCGEGGGQQVADTWPELARSL